MRIVIAEKNQAARKIAEALGRVRRERVRKHPVYLVDDDTAVVPLRGHVVETDFPDEMNNWRRTPLRELAVAPVEKRITEKAIAEALRKYGRDAREIVVATDYDAEGELIGLEAVEIVRRVNRRAPVRRARFSALAPRDVRAAFAKLTDLDRALAAAGEARQVVDLTWGAVLTRFVTLTGNRRGKDFLSVGRVQTPTLALVVDREREIDAFEPEPFWEVSAKLRTPAGDGFQAQHEGNRFEDAQKAVEARDRAARAAAARVTRLDRQPRTRRAPPPFDTTSFLQACGRVGVKPGPAAKIAEKLYTEGLISYPRTDNTVYPKSTPFDRILGEVAKVTQFKEKVAALRRERRPRPTRGKKETTDHPPIHPVTAPRRKLAGAEWKVYAVVVERFLATLAPDARLETTTVRIPIGGEPFRAKGTRVVEPGWLAYEPRGLKKEEVLPALEEGMRLAVVAVENEEKETQPPPRFGQTKLVKEMERLGLGTKSTRANIIQNLYDRGYLEGDPARPTPVAYAVVDAMREGAPEITSPDMTADLESRMERVARAELQRDQLTGASGEQLVAVVDKLEAQRARVQDALRKVAPPSSSGGGGNGGRGKGRGGGTRLWDCPECKEHVVLRKSRAGKRFAGCSGYPACKATWPLLQKGAIRARKGKCEKCGGPTFSLREGKRTSVCCVTDGCRHREWPKPRSRGRGSGA